MKKKIRHIEEHRKEFEIEVPPQEVKRRKDELFDRLSRTAEIPGFRAGKAPRDLLEKHYGERVTRDVVEELIADSYHKAVEEEGIVPLGLPRISDVKLDEASALFFKAEFNIRPKVELKDYKGLKLSEKKPGIKDEDIQRSIKNLQESTAKFRNAEGRPAQIGDYIVCDSEILIGGKAVAKKRENIWMPLEEKSYIPGLSKRLVGANINEEKEIDAVLPGDFPAKEHANKPAVFKIRIKEIKEKVLAKIDDEFAKDLGYNSLPELEDSLRKMLLAQSERQSRQDLEDQAAARLLEKTGLSVPGSLVERQLEYLIEEEGARLKKEGLKEEDVKAKDKELRETLGPVAEKQIKMMFILDEIAAKENITASAEDIDAAVGEIARQHNQSKAKIEKYYREKDLITNLRVQIRNAKIFDMLIKEADIKESPSSQIK
ncbi:MAG: trigger factor [Candidatus Omnitrophica bacterium]|nr:trigger factor [Candidatus Omnitrophota bacterium]